MNKGSDKLKIHQVQPLFTFHIRILTTDSFHVDNFFYRFIRSIIFYDTDDMIRIPDLIDIVLYFFLYLWRFSKLRGFLLICIFFFIKEMIIFDNIDPSLFSV